MLAFIYTCYISDGSGMLDPNFFEGTRRTHLDLFSSAPRILRFIIFFYFTSAVVHHLPKILNSKNVGGLLISACVLWGLLYLSQIVLYSLPEDFSTVFVFMYFGWFLNLGDFATPTALFSEFTYLGGMPKVCNLSQWIMHYKLEYSAYLTAGPTTRSALQLDQLIIKLTSVAGCLLYFFDIWDWTCWAFRWVFVLPIFLLLPEWLCPFISPDNRFLYPAYMLRGALLWVNVMAQINKNSDAASEGVNQVTAVLTNKELVIEFLLNLINNFQYVLVY